jgi:hypothetical protein
VPSGKLSWVTSFTWHQTANQLQVTLASWAESHWSQRNECVWASSKHFIHRLAFWVILIELLCSSAKSVKQVHKRVVYTAPHFGGHANFGQEIAEKPNLRFKNAVTALVAAASRKLKMIGDRKSLTTRQLCIRAR